MTASKTQAGTGTQEGATLSPETGNHQNNGCDRGSRGGRGKRRQEPTGNVSPFPLAGETSVEGKSESQCICRVTANAAYGQMGGTGCTGRALERAGPHPKAPGEGGAVS